MPGQVGRKMSRVQRFVLPLLRASIPIPDDNIGSWYQEVTTRTYPLVNVRRLGGLDLPSNPDDLALPVVEITSYTDARDNQYEGLVGAEELLLDCLNVLWKAVDNQTVIPGVGNLHSFFITFGPTQLDSPFESTWRVQSLVQLGLRPLYS